MFSASSRLAAIAVLALLAAPATVRTAQRDGPPLPAALERSLSDAARLTSHERQQLLSGGPLVKLLDAEESSEVAVFGAIWIDAPARRYVALAQDVENLERGGGFRVTRRIGDVPALADFADWRLSDEDFQDLRRCRVGDCAVKLGEADIERVRTQIDWHAATARRDADDLMRRLALDYVTGYLEGGSARLPVYRDRSRAVSVAGEFRDMVGRMPLLTASLQRLRQFLLDFPKTTLRASSSFLYWQETEFGLKPTHRINHVVTWEAPDETVVASKMLYASHYFWTALELRRLIPDAARGGGFWFVTVKRSRADGMSGFSGFFVRRRVRSEVEDGTRTALRLIKRRLEGTK